MTACSLSSTYQKSGSIPGGDGMVYVTGTFTGPATYNAGGSILDLSTVLASKVYGLRATPRGDATLTVKWVPGAANATALNKIFLDGDGIGRRGRARAG